MAKGVIKLSDVRLALAGVFSFPIEKLVAVFSEQKQYLLLRAIYASEPRSPAMIDISDVARDLARHSPGISLIFLLALH